MKRYLLAFLLVGSLHADALFTFDSDAIGTAIPFTDVGVGSTSGVLATFGGPVYATGSVVAVDSSLLPGADSLVSGNALSFYTIEDVTITFNQNISSLSFDYGVYGANAQNVSIEVFGYENGSLSGLNYSSNSVQFNLLRRSPEVTHLCSPKLTHPS